MLSFTGNPLDRASERRADPQWIAAQRQKADALFLPVWQDKILLRNDQMVFLAPSQLDGTTDFVVLFLGLGVQRPYFALGLPQGDNAPLAGLGEFHDMRAAAFVLSPADTALAGQAKTLIDWHRRHGFCPNCGGRTAIEDGGYRRLCTGCGAEHFPRTDPVAIMLPIHGEECLLGHNKRFREGYYSAFAGFAEPGETLEEAVIRELKEEAGLAVGRVRYHASQPWPFPSSLMLGCYAEALSTDFLADGREIEAARWMGRSELRSRLAGEKNDAIKLPAAIAIARKLIEDWVDEDWVDQE
ncbi:MAG: NAD(+) diphosphatase [Rhizomicrobium sp.]